MASLGAAAVEIRSPRTIGMVCDNQSATMDGGSAGVGARTHRFRPETCPPFMCKVRCVRSNGFGRQFAQVQGARARVHLPASASLLIWPYRFGPRVTGAGESGGAVRSWQSPRNRTEVHSSPVRVAVETVGLGVRTRKFRFHVAFLFDHFWGERRVFGKVVRGEGVGFCHRDTVPVGAGKCELRVFPFFSSPLACVRRAGIRLKPISGAG